MSRDAFVQPVTAASMRSELAAFSTAKAVVSDPDLLRRWCDRIRTKHARFVKAVTDAGYTRAPVPELTPARDDTELFARWMGPIVITAKDSSLGLWSGHFGAYRTKKEVLNAFLRGECVAEFVDFVRRVDEVHRWLASDMLVPGEGMPLKVFGKQEPMPLKKVLEGRHRTIQMPDWTVLIVECAYEAWVKDGILYNNDSVFSLTRVGGEIGGGLHVVGSDMLKELPAISKLFRGQVIDYDVKHWDRSLHSSVVDTLYEVFVGRGSASSKRVAKNLAGGICQNGTYIVGRDMYRLPPGCCAWCSGSLLTLSGNSHAHDCLLEEIGAFGIVCGDDGNVDSATISKEALSEAFRSVGLQLKSIEINAGLHFCKMRVEDERVSIDFGKVLAKMRAKHGRDVDARCGAAIDYIRRMVNTGCPGTDYDRSEYDRDLDWVTLCEE